MEVYLLNMMNKPITRRKILDSSKLKKFADDNFKFHENGRKLSKRVENTLGKGEIARYEQFLLFPQCFQKTCFPGASKVVIVWEWVKDIGLLLKQFLKNVNLKYHLTFYHTIPTIDDTEKEDFRKHCWKRRKYW